ncbi:transposon protein, putative, mutator sub-class [Panicum miliaceum]|uniref:Transposon protein, putative, mutator sub-class n=1 Tax=Panicum miliaceum TaxID=4540 RepID=A0A3L6PIC3_PANMI|nr:transposon protein, putative, mutator sub-class [Panicum miliaceum]
MGAVDVPVTWREELLGRFAHVQRNGHALPYRVFTLSHGPTKSWLLQFSTRQGQAPGALWAAKVLPYVQAWDSAVDDVVDDHRPHSEEAFTAYLQWFLPRTRTRVMHIPQHPRTEPAQVTDTYPLSRDQNFGMAVCLSILFSTTYKVAASTNVNL